MKIKVIKETKFKDVVLSVRFRSPLSKETVTNKVILADILSNVCEKYPSKQEVSYHLNTLYGASLSSSCITYGQSQVLEFSSKAIHSSYIQNKENLLEEQVKLLSEFILKPLVDEAGLFMENGLEEAKRMTLARITRSNDEPSQYCSTQAMTIIGADQPLGIHPMSDAVAVQNLKNIDLKAYYLTMLQTDAIDVLVLGDVEETEVESLFSKYFNFEKKDVKLPSQYKLKISEFDPLYYGDRDITQAYISLVYATQVENKDEDFWALRLANAILGQTPSSFLFREVREKHSLCYSIHSSVLAYDGVLGINVGVDPENVDRTISLIQEQVQRVKDGNFDDELLETTKLIFSNMMRSSYDEPNSLLAYTYRNIVLDIDETIEDVLTKIASVTRSDILNVMKKCTYLSGYVLRKGGAVYENNSK